jgi:hypothetical protein
MILRHEKIMKDYHDKRIYQSNLGNRIDKPNTDWGAVAIIIALVVITSFCLGVQP